jgi:hypothetical protein
VLVGPQRDHLAQGDPGAQVGGHRVAQAQPQDRQPPAIAHVHVDGERLPQEGTPVVVALDGHGSQGSPRPPPAQHVHAKEGVEQVEEMIDLGEKGDDEQDDEERQDTAHYLTLRLSLQVSDV